MRIGIDGLNLAMVRGTGIATYARSLSHCIGDLGHSVDVLYGLNIPPRAEPLLQETLFFDLLESERGRKAPKFPSLEWASQSLDCARSLAAVEIKLTGRTIATQLNQRLPRYDRILNIQDLFGLAGRYFRDFRRFLSIRINNPPDIMHWTYPVPIRLVGSRNIYTIHDLVPLRLPYTTLDNKSSHLRLLQGCFRYGDHIATVSETSRRDILALFPTVSPERVTNTYQALSHSPHPVGPDEVERIVRGGFGLSPRGYFLFFGSIEPKKNVGRLLEAHLSSGTALPLVIVGARAWKSETELALLKYRPPDDRHVRQIEYLPADVLGMLIRGARAVVFPSLYEGFGLPILEAMSLGTPVLTSRGGALAEIAAEAALLVDPYDPNDIAGGLQRLSESDELCADLAGRGRARAACFSMEQYRDRIVVLYDQVLAAGISD